MLTLTTTATATAIIESRVTEISQAHRELAQRLSERHGKIRLTREVNGIHAYMASPECLVRDGDKELRSMHLAVNLDKYLLDPEGKGDRCACCMKTAKPFRMSELLDMPSLELRGIRASGPREVQVKDVTEDRKSVV